MSDATEPTTPRPTTHALIESALTTSRRRYPCNNQLLSALLMETAELTLELQRVPIGERIPNPKRRRKRIALEAADCIAVLVRIIEEGDGSFGDRWGSVEGEER